MHGREGRLDLVIDLKGGNGMHANRHSLAVLGMLGAVFFAAAPASAQCTDQWLPGEGLPGLNGDVYATAVYDDGTGPALYVGGSFSVVGDVVATNIAKWDGTSWSPLGSGTNNNVYDLTVYNGELIAGGEFTTAGETAANRIARWDGTTWSPLGSGMGGEYPHVSALTVYNGELIAGGGFTTAGGTSANRIARWDPGAPGWDPGAPGQWSPLGSGIGGPYSFVRALTVFNGELIAGGGFSSVGGTPANNIAYWDGLTWSPLGSGMRGGYPYVTFVFALTLYNGELIAGGSFYTAGGTEAHNIARWDGTIWSPLGSGVSHRVLALTEYNGELIAGGWFHTAGGTSANHIARWDGQTWSPLGSGMTEDPGATYVSALTEYNGELVAGGEFSTAGGTVVNSIARWEGTQWSPLGSGMNGSVRALTEYNGELIAGGWFTTAGGTEANKIARWDGTTWSPLGSGMNSTSTVLALTVYNGELIAGGSFTTADGKEANRIGRWDGTSWSALGSGTNSVVWALTVYNGELIAGGEFTTAGGTPANHIARWDGTSWSPLGSGMTGCADPYGCTPAVTALAVYNGELIAGGNFLTAGGKGANNIARWDGRNWSPLGSGMTVCGGEYCPITSVGALAVYNGELIAGGEFTAAGGTVVNHIARWEGTTWSPLASGMNSRVLSVTEYNGELIAGGYFTTAGGTPANHIVRWDGTTWSPLGSGMGAALSYYTYVRTSTVYNGELIAGGNFTTAGGNVSAFWARWGADVPLGDLDGDCNVGVLDLLQLLAAWGPCADCEDCPADLDGDCTVGILDLLALLANWG